MCGGDCMETPPSASILMFWLTRDETELGGGAFPPANDTVQVRLRAPRSTATGRDPDRRKLRMWIYSPSEQAEKTCSRARVSLGLAFSHFGALKERLGSTMQSWATL